MAKLPAKKTCGGFEDTLRDKAAQQRDSLVQRLCAISLD